MILMDFRYSSMVPVRPIVLEMPHRHARTFYIIVLGASFLSFMTTLIAN